VNTVTVFLAGEFLTEYGQAQQAEFSQPRRRPAGGVQSTASPLRFAQPRTASRRTAPHRFAPPASPRPRYSTTQGASAATRRWREQRGGACCGERRGPARANRGACPPVVPARVPCTQVAVAAICVARACAHLRRRARSRRDLAPASRRRAPRGWRRGSPALALAGRAQQGKRQRNRE
jgi:hypothetical protein